MKKWLHNLISVLLTVLMFLLIIDAKTITVGAMNGVVLCIYTVLPSLLPFCFLGKLISDTLIGRELSVLRPLARLCGIPGGFEYLLLLGILGGYPVGAKAVADAYSTGKLSRKCAERMLLFCSNGGPAFIFGLMAPSFRSIYIAAIIWSIHILSAVLIGFLLPSTDSIGENQIQRISLSVPDVLNSTLKTIAGICGWVIIFRILIELLQTHILWTLPAEYSAILYGILELVNGTSALSGIPAESFRFVVGNCILSLGGMCVFMQTCSVIGSLRFKFYLRGKLLQSLITFTTSVIAQYFIFTGEPHMSLVTLCISIPLTIAYVLYLRKKV